MKWSTQTLVLSLRRKDSPPPGDGKHCQGCRGRNDEDAHEAQEDGQAEVCGNLVKDVRRNDEDAQEAQGDGQAEVCGDQDSQRSILGRPVLRLATVVL